MRLFARFMLWLAGSAFISVFFFFVINVVARALLCNCKFVQNGSWHVANVTASKWTLTL